MLCHPISVPVLYYYSLTPKAEITKESNFSVVSASFSILPKCLTSCVPDLKWGAYEIDNGGSKKVVDLLMLPFLQFGFATYKLSEISV